MLNPARLLSPAEIDQILVWLHHRRRRGPNYVLNRAIFRLSCCYGLRCGELCRLNVGDVFTRGAFAALSVGESGDKQRIVRIDWDAGALADIVAYKEARLASLGASPRDQPFLAGATTSKRLTVDLAGKRWRSVIKVVLGAERAKALSTQSGRRTFPSYAAAHGLTLAQITKALGNNRVETAALCLYAAQKRAG